MSMSIFERSIVSVSAELVEVDDKSNSENCPLEFFSKKRVFLIGDSIIKQMFSSADCITEDFAYVPKAVDKNLLIHTGKFRIKSGPYSYLIGNFVNATPMAIELEYLRPTKNDVLVACFGAHSYHHQKEEFHDFMKNVYYLVVKPFPGHVFWFEPLPQHFKKGIYLDYPEKKCYPLSRRNSEMQYWRVEEFRRQVIPTRQIHTVPVYDELAPLWNEHPKRYTSDNDDSVTYADCTHYSDSALLVALAQLEKVVKSVFGSKL